MSDDMMVKVEPININGVNYLTVNQYAFLTNKTPQAIYYSIKSAKGKTKIAHDEILGQILIPLSEYQRQENDVKELDAAE